MDDGGDFKFIQSAANKAAAARAVRRGADAAAPLVGLSVVVVPEPEPEPEPVPVVLPRFNQL